MKFLKQGRTDGKQHFEIKFGIPLWVIEPYERLVYLCRKWKYKFNPDRCSCCGKKMYVTNFEIAHVFSNGRGLTVHNHAFNRTTKKTIHVCRECLLTELETKEWTPRFSCLSEELGHARKYNYRFWSNKKCAITSKYTRSYKDVEITPYVDMTFCTNAWNYDYISKEAVIECVREGRITTSIWGVYKKKKMTPMNNKRLFINEKGELL